MSFHSPRGMSFASSVYNYYIINIILTNDPPRGARLQFTNEENEYEKY